MAQEAICSAVRRRVSIVKEGLSPLLAVGEILKHDTGGRYAPRVEPGIERLNAADKLTQRFLNSRLVNSRGAERDVEKQLVFGRSEERRVGKECRSRWSPY